MEAGEALLRAAYEAFNARDLDAAVALMHPEVDWPNAWEGGRVRGRKAVRDYWRRQFAVISSRVEPRSFTQEADGSITVVVRQVVHEARVPQRIPPAEPNHKSVGRDKRKIRQQATGGRALWQAIFEHHERRHGR